MDKPKASSNSSEETGDTVATKSGAIGESYNELDILSFIILAPASVKLLIAGRLMEAKRASRYNKLTINELLDGLLPNTYNTNDSLAILRQKGQERLTEQPEHSPSISSAEERSQHLAALLATVPKDEEYEKKATALAGLSHEFRQRIAAELAPALNRKIRGSEDGKTQGMEHGTLDQKKELARWVNDQLEPLGLAVQCPNTGRPAKLRGVAGGSSWPDLGRFCFETQGDGKREKSSYSETLPELTLTDSDPSQGLDPSWQAKVGPKTRRLGRKRP